MLSKCQNIIEKIIRKFVIFKKFKKIFNFNSRATLKSIIDVFGQKWSYGWVTVKKRVHERVQKWLFLVKIVIWRKLFNIRKLLFDPPNYMFSSKNFYFGKNFCNFYNFDKNWPHWCFSVMTIVFPLSWKLSKIVVLSKLGLCLVIISRLSFRVTFHTIIADLLF